MPSWNEIKKIVKSSLDDFREMDWEDLRVIPAKQVLSLSSDAGEFEISVLHSAMLNGTSSITIMVSRPVFFCFFYRIYICGFEKNENGKVVDYPDKFDFETRKSRAQRLAWEATNE